MKHIVSNPFLITDMQKINPFTANTVQSRFSKKTKLSLFILLLLVFPAVIEMNAQALRPSQQEVYSRVKVKASPLQFAKMNAAIGFDHLSLEKGGSFIGEFSQSEIAIMKQL
ncbi:MAG: hypothetical protein JWN78_1436, partial [Bacteroidota bacterium]|nr:hypothetical protein [Bacteroidota bacterium]